MEYRPEDRGSRRHLAACVIQTLLQAGFAEEWHDGCGADPTKEKVYFRDVDGVERIRLVVYTSIVQKEGEEPEVREVGKDAIRVVAVYRSKGDDKERGILKETRVHRTGDTDEIANRMLERMRDAYRKSKRVNRCPKCGAPMFVSKKGNEVCCEVCWKPQGQATPQRNYDEEDYEGDAYAGTLRPVRYGSRRRWY